VKHKRAPLQQHIVSHNTPPIQASKHAYDPNCHFGQRIRISNGHRLFFVSCARSGLVVVVSLLTAEEVRTRGKIRWRVLGGPCAWVARQYPPPPARRSPPPHLALGTSASLRHLYSCSLRCHQQPLHHVPCKAALVLGPRANVLRRRPAARSPPAASPSRPVHHVDSCCCSRCLRAAAPCPPPCRALPRTVLTTPRPSHPQPSARNRPGERMSLLDQNTYKRPDGDAEVLSLITPAAARARDVVRRISHATRSGQRRPVAKRSTGRGQGKGRRGRRRRGRTTPHIRHRSRAPRKHPVPHIRPTHLVAHPPPLIAAVFHAQHGCLPLHFAACYSSSVAVVQALLAAYPEAAMARANVCRPSPLAAWMRGHQQS
jgi:hypothetical protein